MKRQAAYLIRMALTGLFVLYFTHSGFAAQSSHRHDIAGRLLGGHADFVLEQLPAGKLRTHIELLPPQARQRAQSWLGGFSFPPEDLDHLQVDPNGGIYYVDLFPTPQAEGSETEASPDVPVQKGAATSLPSSLYFHSRPGATKILYLDFDGEAVTGTAWNDSLGRDTIEAVAFSTDSDYLTFSETEQLTIERIWQRVAEDYAPFDIDVTTERPAVFNSLTAHCLITRDKDAGGLDNPSVGSGGVAYVNVFGLSSYDYYRPAWVYYNNLSSRESYIAEAASHEIGHNMGLSHDGKTDGTGYYTGHGTGYTSWAPIMGVGYSRHVTQWSNGEYYMANNTEDDMAIIAGKLQLRNDDHGDSRESATYLTISDGTNIVATTPADDPENSSAENKGIVEDDADIDVFSFITGAGEVQLNVVPWISPASYRGGNLDVHMALYDADDFLIAENNPSSTTEANLIITLPEGQYFLKISGTGTGDPLNSTPTGYAGYASLGQYFISGQIIESSGFVIPPQASLIAENIEDGGLSSHLLNITYSDDTAIEVDSIDDADVRVTGPDGYNAIASFNSIDFPDNGTPRLATYNIPPPGTTWQPSDNGTYEVYLLSNAVSDVEGAYAAPLKLGEFLCAVPASIYQVDLNEDPGWALDGDWAYGVPQGSEGDPSSGYDGASTIGNNLSGSYGRRQSAVYATTPAIDCSTSTNSVVLRFRRWLGIQSGDSAFIDLSTDGVSWSSVWSSSGAIEDGAWTSVLYDITSIAGGQQTVYIRWGLSSNPDGRVNCGWNLDAIELLGSGGMLDTLPPTALLNAPGLTEGGNPNYQFTIQYTDNVGIAAVSLGDTNLYVLGPNAYSNTAAFSGIDDNTDGTPRTASYTIQAPGGQWNETDNGDYEIFMKVDQVVDTSGNPVPPGSLGVAVVAIVPQWTLNIDVHNPAWGYIAPNGGIFQNGSLVNVTAHPDNHYSFAHWTGDLSGTNPVETLLMDGNKHVQAVFSEILATNSVPQSWLAQYGFTNDFDTAALNIASNGMTYWESYIAGLDANDPAAVFTVTNMLMQTNATMRIDWQAVSGRVYSVYQSTNLLDSFHPVSGATDIAWPSNSYTVPVTNFSGYYRIEISLE